jgi:metal-responsive CopG/Arc/MetJ family transcriptional regulator
VERVTFRMQRTLLAALDELATREGITRSRLVRAALEDLVAGKVARKRVAVPSEDELVALLAERALEGNIAAIRSLLAREHLTDPRTRAIELFAAMVEGRQS